MLAFSSAALSTVAIAFSSASVASASATSATSTLTATSGATPAHATTSCPSAAEPTSTLAATTVAISTSSLAFTSTPIAVSTAVTPSTEPRSAVCKHELRRGARGSTAQLDIQRTDGPGISMHRWRPCHSVYERQAGERVGVSARSHRDKGALCDRSESRRK